MSSYLIPNKEKKVTQPNTSSAMGSLQMSYGIDLTQEPGIIKNSYGLKNIFDESDDAQFTHPAYVFLTGGYNVPSTAKYWAVLPNYVFYSDTEDPSTGWVQDATTNTPTLSNRADAAAFGSGTAQQLFVTGDSTGTIWTRTPDAAGNWTDWWVTTKGKAALSTSYYTPVRTAPNNRLYIVDSQRKVYFLDNDINGQITTSGNGTLDISYSGHRILTLEPSSSRMWLGTYAISTGRGGVIEWDMSSNSTEFNRLHELPAPVISICIWNDIPYAVTMNGEIHAFDGTRFVKYAQFPVPDGFTGFTGTNVKKTFLTPDDWTLMHPRGWAIIDGLPHFLVNGQQANTTALTGSKQTYWKMPSGIWCLDPNVGLYCRFPLDVDLGAGSSTGAQAVKATGALFAANFAKAKFLAGVDFYTDSSGTAKASLLKDDVTRTLATRGRFALSPLKELRKALWGTIEVLHKKLGNSSDRIILKYRQHRSESLPNYADVTWSSTTQFTSTSSTFANATAGDEILVILGDGAGCSAHISSVSYANPTYTVTLDDTILGVSNAETGTVRVDNWRKIATISNQTVDYHDFNIATASASRQIECLIELRAAAGSTIEIDQLIITSDQT